MDISAGTGGQAPHEGGAPTGHRQAGERAAARERASEGWRHLAAFSREGCAHLAPALAALREAEQLQRRIGSSEDLEVTLMGLSLALRLRRDPEEGRRAIVLAQELVNLMRKRRGDVDGLPYRAHLEAAYRDLAELESGEAAARTAEGGIEACNRTLRLARTLRVPQVVPPAQATKAALLLRLAAVRPGADAARARREAEKLYAGALEGWAGRDAVGRAVVHLEMAEMLGAHPRTLGRAERLLHEAAAALETAGNRYLAARAARVRARLALAAGLPEALDDVEHAAAAFRALGCEGEAREVEALV